VVLLEELKKPIRILDLFCRIGSPFRAVAPLQELLRIPPHGLQFGILPDDISCKIHDHDASAVDSMVALRREREELNSS
jgi:hypothetical protein